MRQRSVAYAGSTTLLQAVVDRLNADEPITFVALGGSITNGRGVGFPSDYKGSWSKLVFDWIQDMWPNAKHTYVNGAASATDVSYFASCLYRHCPMDADIVILEHAVNTAPGQKATASMERLVRRLLSRSQRNASTVNNTSRAQHRTAPYHTRVKSTRRWVPNLNPNRGSSTPHTSLILAARACRSRSCCSSDTIITPLALFALRV
eukprot:1727913-Pyramimonas_sp.AAC.2